MIRPTGGKTFNCLNCKNDFFVKIGVCNYREKMGVSIICCCEKCRRELQQKNKKTRKQICADYRDNHKQKYSKMTESESRYLSKKYFGGMRDIILTRDKHLCTRCGSAKNIIIHHVDRNKKNNSLENLITLCKACHVIEHVKDRISANREYACDRCGKKFIRKRYLAKNPHVFCTRKCSALFRYGR